MYATAESNEHSQKIKAYITTTEMFIAKLSIFKCPVAISHKTYKSIKA